MTKEEAERILGLSKKYNEQELKRAYKHLLRIYHPDNQNGISEEEKAGKAKDIITAYNILITSTSTYSLQHFLAWSKTLKNEEFIERQYKNFSLTKIPEELQIKIEDKFQKFFSLSKMTQLKIYNLEQETMNRTLYAYENGYYNIRSDLTYIFFNYFEAHVQLKWSKGKSLYQKNAEEYCGEGEESPIILDTLYEIVKKFLNYFDFFLKEKQKMQKEVEEKVKEQLKEITEKYKKTENKELTLEIANTLNEALKEVERICQISPLQEINIMRLDLFLKEFEKTIKNMCEGYATFLEHKTEIVDLLEENIKSFSLDLMDNGLLEELSSLKQVQEKNAFELGIGNIIEKSNY